MDNIFVYNSQLAMLKQLQEKELITTIEYKIIKMNLMKKYKINGRFLAC